MTTRTLNGTGRLIAPAADNRGRRPEPLVETWENRAACTVSDEEDLYSTLSGTRKRVVETLCGACPVRAECLDAALVDDRAVADVWGIRGGLTAVQRRALRAERLLGSVVDVEQARELTSGRWPRVLRPLRMRGLSPVQMAAELAEKGLRVSPATVRVAVWWLGGRAPVLPRRRPGDEREEWQLIRDECRSVVGELKGRGALVADVAAYLAVPRTVLEMATRAWRAEQQSAVSDQEVGLAA